MGNLIELNRFVTFIITKNIVKLGFFIQIIFVISVRTNNLFLTLFVKIKVLVAYAVPKNYVVVKLLIIQMYTALLPFDSCWWLASNVVDYAINVSNFVYDTS